MRTRFGKFYSVATTGAALSFASLAGHAEESDSSKYIDQVAPLVASNQTQWLDAQLWQRKELSARDRSIVTLAALIARGQLAAMPEITAKALDSQVTPEEIAEIINHLAFYSGFANARAAIEAIGPVYETRGIKVKQLPSNQLELLSYDKKAEQQRRTFVANTYGDVSPGTVEFTTDALFMDLWLRPGLAARDRSLVTVSALVATGQVEQVNFHLNKAMDNGLTETQAGEILTQIAFYSGWPKTFSALPVFKEIFASRKK